MANTPVPTRAQRIRQLWLFFAVMTAPCTGTFAQRTGTPHNLVGHPAPGFSRQDLQNHAVDLNAYRGKVVLLNFWATWCGPCLTEIPHFAEWQHQYGPNGLQVIGVSMDDSDSPVRAANARRKLDYPIVMGDERLGAAYGDVLGLPVTFLIDTEGRVRARYQGASQLSSMQRQIEALLPRK